MQSPRRARITRKPVIGAALALFAAVTLPLLQHAATVHAADSPAPPAPRTQAPKKPVDGNRVTAGNFDLIKMSSPGRRSLSVLSVDRTGKAHISYRPNIPTAANKECTVTLSATELSQLLTRIDAARIPTLKPEYRQERAFEVRSVTITLRLRPSPIVGAPAAPTEFVIYAYGYTAPKAFLQLVDYLVRLRDKKCPVPDGW